MINLLMCIISALFGSEDKTQTSLTIEQKEITQDQTVDTSVTQSAYKPIFHS